MKCLDSKILWSLSRTSNPSWKVKENLKPECFIHSRGNFIFKKNLNFRFSVISKIFFLWISSCFSIVCSRISRPMNSRKLFVHGFFGDFCFSSLSQPKNFLSRDFFRAAGLDWRLCVLHTLNLSSRRFSGSRKLDFDASAVSRVVNEIWVGLVV